jgi:hypothetical protein
MNNTTLNLLNFILLGLGLLVWAYLFFFLIEKLKRVRLCPRTQAELKCIATGNPHVKND